MAGGRPEHGDADGRHVSPAAVRFTHQDRSAAEGANRVADTVKIRPPLLLGPVHLDGELEVIVVLNDFFQ